MPNPFARSKLRVEPNIPPPPPPSPEQTRAAVRELAVARQYLDAWYKEKDSDMQSLSFATQRVAKARSLDPSAVLVMEGKDSTREYTVDNMSMELLHNEGIVHQASAQNFDGKARQKTLKNAEQCFLKALNYEPYAVHSRLQLANVYLDLYDRKKALDAAKEVIAQAPDNVQAHRFVDRLESDDRASAKHPHPKFQLVRSS